MKTKEQIIEILEGKKTRSAWEKGVLCYAIDLVYDCEGDVTKENLLNGAQDWKQYSEGGCSLIYDSDIAEMLCTPSELVKKDFGRLPPNGQESWIDVQARALFQAWRMIKWTAMI